MLREEGAWEVHVKNTGQEAADSVMAVAREDLFPQSCTRTFRRGSTLFCTATSGSTPLTRSTCTCVEMPSMSRSRSRLIATSVLMDRVLGFERYRNQWFSCHLGLPCILAAPSVFSSQRRTGQRHAISMEFLFSPSNGVVFELVSCLFL